MKEPDKQADTMKNGIMQDKAPCRCPMKRQPHNLEIPQ
jgi:hypothetical protein